MPVTTRSRSKSLLEMSGIDNENEEPTVSADDGFTKSLLVALKNTEVSKVLGNIVMTELRNELTSLKIELKKRDERIEGLENRVVSLEKECDRLEQYSRRNSIRIAGIPENDHEDPCERSMKIINDVIKPKAPITHMDIDRIHRVGKKSKDGKPRAMLIKFSTYRARKRVMDAKVNLKDQLLSDDLPNKLFLNDDLTRTRSHLCYLAREKKKEGLLNDVWTADGTILIKDLANKIHSINSIQDLNKQV